MNKILSGALAAGTAIILFAGAANAASYSYVAFSGNIAAGGNVNTNINKFNSALGTLTKVEVFGSLQVTDAYQRFENQDNQSAVLTAKSDAFLDLSISGLTGEYVGGPLDGLGVGPTSALIETLGVQFTNVFNSTAFDGTVDFAGTSGKAYEGLSDSDAYSLTYTTGDTYAGAPVAGSTPTYNWLDNFTGAGTILFNALRTGSSSVTGSNTITSQLSTPRETSLTVRYTYETIDPPSVPLPAALPLLGAGMAAMGFVARRRNKNA